PGLRQRGKSVSDADQESRRLDRTVPSDAFGDREQAVARRLMSEAFLHIRRRAEGFELEGAQVGALGHKIRHPGRSEPDGVFVEWSWDGNRLRVRNDRYGCYPFYYFANSDEIAISTSIVRLLEAGASPVLDDVGLAAFLRLGFFLGEDTPFLEIRALLPSPLLEWRNGDLAVSGRITITKPENLNRDAAIDGYISLFRDAVRRRQPSRPNVGQSGYVSTQEVIELSLQIRNGNIPDVAIFYDGINDTDAAFQHGVAGVPPKEINREGEFNLLQKDELRSLAVRDAVKRLSIIRFINGALSGLVASRSDIYCGVHKTMIIQLPVMTAVLEKNDDLCPSGKAEDNNKIIIEKVNLLCTSLK